MFTPMIVRRAIASDLDQYVICANAFHDQSPMAGVVGFDAEGFAQFFTRSIASQSVGLFVAEESDVLFGIAGAVVYPLYFSPQATVAQELFWWLDPSKRGKSAGKEMFSALELWAKEHGAVQLFMIALANERFDGMAKLYQRMGFAPMEVSFRKGL